jgi:hypothetical protein
LPKYFFAIRWPDAEHADEDGVDFPDEAAARDYADRIIRELQKIEGYDDPGLEMVVTDDSGQELFVLPFRLPH